MKVVLTKGVVFMKRSGFVFLLPGVLFLFCALTASSALAQDASQALRKIQLSAADDSAAADSITVYGHAFASKTEAGAKFRSNQASSFNKRVAGLSSRFSGGASVEGNDHLRFPGDLSNFFGGPTVPFAQSHAIFLLPNGSCPIAVCFGDPLTFLDEFGESGLSHVTDQYVGQSSNNRYTLGDSFAVSFVPTPSTAPLTDANIRAIVHAVAQFSGQTGFNHIFHVFLPPGQDECFTSAATVCYSPDVPASFAFCAYHSSVTFKDIGHVLYTVEPFQNVPGCQARPGTPNGQLVDSANDTLSHELTETITDPDGDAWFNFSDGGLAGEEIGDECTFFVILQIAPNVLATFGDPTVFSVEKHVFATQPEYSNQDHACAIRP
jgi:hypothetical protein